MYMTREELIEYSIHEIKWLRYYSTRRSREDLVSVKNLYNDLVRMGYSKRQMSLHRRCSGVMLTSDKEIGYLTDMSDIYISSMDRDTGNNIFTSLEVLIKIYPLEGDNVLRMLQDGGINPEINLV